MLHVRRPQTPALKPFIDMIWVCHEQTAHAYERLLPNGRMQILIDLSGNGLPDYELDGHLRHMKATCAVLQGTRTRPVLIDTSAQRKVCGVSFNAGGSYPFFKNPAVELMDQLVDLSELWGRDGRRLQERVLEAKASEAQIALIEAGLVEQAWRQLVPDSALTFVCDLLGKGVTVRLIEQTLGMCPRDLIAWFRDRTGVAPKLFARLERFQALIGSIDERSTWGELAAQHGYADQAHLIREFREFSGLTPTLYRSAGPAFPNHVPAAIP
jgi:AraC-like DNA-binding protein